jgi:hypothetical protein
MGQVEIELTSFGGGTDMATLFVRHPVSDYAAWRRVYDSIGAMQKAGGVIADSVYQSADNPNDVTVTHEFASIEAARTFVSSPDLKAAMEKAGVSGPPTIWFATKR